MLTGPEIAWSGPGQRTTLVATDGYRSLALFLAVCEQVIIFILTIINKTRAQRPA
ncbi:MAG: hypothetical protein NZ729_08050 [Methylococcales bacterium]|nr:hypothetical protein [Methylococcales bacterium]